MAKKRRRRSRTGRRIRFSLSAIAIAVVLCAGMFGARFFENRTRVDVENAGMQMTSHTQEENTAHVFMNGQWYQKKNVETLLVMGVDDDGAITGGNSYNNTKQADFLVLYIRDKESGEAKAIHLNRDTMADITVLGVTGEAAGMRRAQLALAFNYGRGQQDSSMNTVQAVSRLLYGTEINRYITVTMDAVPVMNNWAGGVKVQILDDLTSVDSALAQGKEIKLTGEQALAYVRSRQGLDDSTNINRMERQRQFASAWVQTAQEKLKDNSAVADLVVQMSDYHSSDCTAEELAEFAASLGENPQVDIYELPGEAIRGADYMEFHVDDAQLQQLILELFYEQV